MLKRVPINGLEPNTIASGAMAGFVTGVFSIPEGMAYAQLAGVNPLYGLYSGLVATLVASLSTGTVLMVSTLTSAIALSTGSVLQVAGIDKGDMPGALFTITLLTGAIMFVLGLLRLGSLVSFVSNAVMTGFVAGAAVLIIIGEIGDFSGYDPKGSNKISELVNWFAHIGDWDLTTTLIALITMALMLIGKRIKPVAKLAPVIVLVIMTVAVAVLQLKSVATVADIAKIPSGLPHPDLPAFGDVPELALGSLSVAIVALVQGAGISSAYPNPDGSRASANRDFIGQGLGNIAGSFFQSMPTGGSLSRTGVSVGGGAKSRWGGIFATLWLGVMVLLFGSVAEKVPLSVIAALLFVIAGELIVGRAGNALLAFRSNWGSTAAMVLTFAAALFIPLQWTIFLGAGLSLLIFIASSSRAGSLKELRRSDDGYWSEHDSPDKLTSGQILIIDLAHWRFFAEVPRLTRRLPQPDGATGAVVILRIRDIPTIEDTGLRALDDYHQQLADTGNTLILTGIASGVVDAIRRVGLERRIGADNLFPAGADVTRALDDAWKHASELTAKS
ncbi:SulP family inorganic anion transporter [Microlunatus elymi]|uniref:SulP family inorganic anion transporter n=1 Tax=Microlunatus elymi TaxID=2596828 RepID=A0A516Q031_9ACTN|nr:SulP family inorganic anion transporter [Microlunatus elymi]QDP96795.1 SulP family inorganic anion transporter [Microlunatus elymi]